MELDSIELDTPKHITVSDLEKRIKDLPINVQGTSDLKLSAHVGLLDVTYFTPLSGNVNHVDYGFDAIRVIYLNEGERLIFEYDNHVFQVDYQ